MLSTKKVCISRKYLSVLYPMFGMVMVILASRDSH